MKALIALALALALAPAEAAAPPPPEKATPATTARLLLSNDVRKGFEAARWLLDRPSSESKAVRQALGTVVEDAGLSFEIPSILPRNERPPLLDRLRQAVLLARLRARDVAIPVGMIAIPGGVARHPITEAEIVVDDFLLDETEVTREAFSRFLTATGHEGTGTGFLADWTAERPPAGTASHPVVHVSRDDATAFARWRNARLPTAAEWTVARRGCALSVQPWGKGRGGDRANVYGKGPGRTEPADGRPAGATPLGVLRLAGNVAEWTSSPWGEVPHLGIAAGESFVTITGFQPEVIRKTRITTRRRDLGFRCARSLGR